jgi:hypothetical protein
MTSLKVKMLSTLTGSFCNIGVMGEGGMDKVRQIN